MIDWLLSVDPKLVPFIQMAASTLLAAASVVVAWAAFRTSRVNSFGTPPAGFFLPVERSAGLEGEGDYLKVRLELWNRRKYPIVVRAVLLEVDEERFRVNDGDGWRWIEDHVVLWDRGKVVDGVGHASWDVRGQASHGGFHEPEGKATVTYYDPHKNREQRLELVREYVRSSPLAVEKHSREWWRRLFQEWRYRLFGRWF